MIANCPPQHISICRREIARIAVDLAATARIGRGACATLPDERDEASATDFAEIAKLADRIASRSAVRAALFPIWDDAQGAP